MSSAERRNMLPYRAIAAVLAVTIIAFGVAVGTGVLEVRCPVTPLQTPTESEAPKTYIQRVKAAESLLDNQNIQWVYKFAGGFPKCWAEIDSEGHTQTVGPWVAIDHPGLFGEGPLDRPLPESVEGYVALFGPTSQEQKYRLVCAVTKIEYPEGAKVPLRTVGFRDPLEVKLPNLLPARELPKDVNAVTARGGSTFHEGENQRIVTTGQDEQINFLLGQETPSGKDRNIRLKIRFLTAEEYAAKK